MQGFNLIKVSNQLILKSVIKKVMTYSCVAFLLLATEEDVSNQKQVKV